ncbi:MAG: hypothetical protein AAGI34_03500 [Pseudomonadota bacterium]
MVVLEILLALAVGLFCWWIWEMSGRARVTAILIGVFVLSFSWPYLLAADWRVVGGWAIGLGLAGVVVLVYARLIQRIRERVEDRGE